MSSSSLVWYAANNFGHSLQAAVILNENAEKWNAGKKWEARFNAFFLIVPEIFLTFKYAFIATVLAPLTVIKIPISFFVIWAWDKDSSAMKIHKQEVGIMLFGEAVFKTIVCAFNILWSPILGFMSPIENLTYHERIGALRFGPETISTEESNEIDKSLTQKTEVPPVITTEVPPVITAVPRSNPVTFFGTAELEKSLYDYLITPWTLLVLYKSRGVCPPNKVVFVGPDPDLMSRAAEVVATQLGYHFVEKKIGNTIETTRAVQDFFYDNEKYKNHVIYLNDTSYSEPKWETTTKIAADSSSNFKTPPLEELDALRLFAQEQEHDSLLMSRAALKEKIHHQLATRLNENIIFIIGTNCSQSKSCRIFTPDQCDFSIEIPIADTKTREKIFRHVLNLKNKCFDLADCSTFAELTSGFTTRDIEFVIEQSIKKLVAKEIEMMNKSQQERIDNREIFNQKQKAPSVVNENPLANSKDSSEYDNNQKIEKMISERNLSNEHRDLSNEYNGVQLFCVDENGGIKRDVNGDKILTVEGTLLIREELAKKGIFPPKKENPEEHFIDPHAPLNGQLPKPKVLNKNDQEIADLNNFIIEEIDAFKSAKILRSLIHRAF